MIKKAVVTSQTPSVISGRRGTVVVNGEAVKPGESVPHQVTRPLQKQLPVQKPRQ